MAGLFDSVGKIARPFMVDDADRPCGHPGCGRPASFFKTATPLATVLGRHHTWMGMWCGDHAPAEFFPRRVAAGRAA